MDIVITNGRREGGTMVGGKVESGKGKERRQNGGNRHAGENGMQNGKREGRMVASRKTLK